MTDASFWENKRAVSVLKHVVGLIMVATVYFTTWPTREEPVLWQPSDHPGLSGDFAENNALGKGVYLGEEFSSGPEGVAIGPDGMLWTGFADGRIVRFDPSGQQQPDVVTNTQGRPLGLQFDPEGNLIVADAFKGLLSVGENGAVTLLTDEVEGQKILFADDLDIKSDGTIWFSDASTRFPYGHDISELLENNPTGRLLVFNPKTRQTKVMLKDLAFANGVAFGPDEDYVLINETHRHRIRRLWLNGPKAGQDDIFVDGLPGYPDNITFNGKDRFWVAMPHTRDATIDSLSDNLTIRKILSRLPHSLFPLPEPIGFVVGIDLNGKITDNFQDRTGKFRKLTSAIEHQNALYLGSLENSAIVKLPLSQ